MIGLQMWTIPGEIPGTMWNGVNSIASRRHDPRCGTELPSLAVEETAVTHGEDENIIICAKIHIVQADKTRAANLLNLRSSTAWACYRLKAMSQKLCDEILTRDCSVHTTSNELS